MSNIFNVMAFMAVALAIFAIGLQYIPEKSLYKMFHTKDIAMIKNFLGNLSLLSYGVFILLLVWLFIDLSDYIMQEIIKIHYLNGTVQFILRLQIVTLFTIIFFAILKWLWLKTKRDTEHERSLNKGKKTEDGSNSLGNKYGISK